jgi:hypothetical protein
MCDIPFDRSILQLSNSIRHVMPSTYRMLELTAKHRWPSRLTAGCVFQWVKIRVFIRGDVVMRQHNMHLFLRGVWCGEVCRLGLIHISYRYR